MQLYVYFCLDMNISYKTRLNWERLENSLNLRGDFYFISTPTMSEILGDIPVRGDVLVPVASRYLSCSGTRERQGALPSL